MIDHSSDIVGQLVKKKKNHYVAYVISKTLDLVNRDLTSVISQAASSHIQSYLIKESFVLLKKNF